MKKKVLIISAIVLLLAGVGVGLYFGLRDKNKNDVVTDGERFAKEYTIVQNDNLFVYRKVDEIIKILENGTGVVYLGFPECPWCQAYVPYLNDVAVENGISRIYYYNILKDRTDNTEEYKKIMELLGEYVEYDAEGNKRIYAPTVIFVDNGTIVGMNSETAKDTKGFEKPEDYWTEEEVSELKSTLKELCLKVKEITCSDCNK